MLFASFEPTGLWWAAPLGMALFFGAINRRTAVWGAWLQGLVLYLLLLPWVGEFVGWYAWIALAIVQSLYSLLFGIGLRWLYRSPSAGHTPRAVIFSGAGIAAWFTATEFIRSSFPFGGFPWGRLAWGQVEGPLAWWVRFGGPALVTFFTVLTGFALAWLIWSLLAGKLPSFSFRRHHARTPEHNPRPLGAACAVALIATLGIGGALKLGGEAAQEGAGEESQSLRVAAIQGNVPRLGLDFAAQRRAVLDNHARQTHKLAELVRSGKEPQPDLVLWPENASDVNPYRSEEAAQMIAEAVRDVQVPIVLGTVTAEHNRMVVWDENGPGDIHDKRFLQPFGEYMPMRDLLRKITPLVDRAGNFHPGTGNGVVQVPQPSDNDTAMTPPSAAPQSTSSGSEDSIPPSSNSGIDSSIPLGIATCYEISFDGALRTAVQGGAQILATPTNNATFGFTNMTYQQLAMSRMRAIEYDRSLVVAATSGVSAIVQPDGSVEEQSRIFTAKNLTADLPLKDNLTTSAIVGPWVEWVLSALGALAVLLGYAWSRSELASKKKNRAPNRGKARNTGARVGKTSRD